MKQQLRKPEHWQDFEELCKTLWGEIWKCAEIKRNGRSGNDQHGVDVYGTPIGEALYYGIQCKGKDDYSNSRLTKFEIDQEIEKAKSFKPQLKKFYFATTANKNSDIEEYIRVKDIENRLQGSFEIHLFCWEDIVFLIDENRQTHDWYVKKIDFKTNRNVKVLLGNGQESIDFSPTMIRNHVTYKVKQKETTRYSPPHYGQLITPVQALKDQLEKLIDPQPVKYYMNGTSYNKSSCEFFLTIENIGTDVIEDYKLKINWKGDIIRIDSTDKQSFFLDLSKKEYNIHINEESNEIIYTPPNKILVQNDIVKTDKICFRPKENEQTILLHWTLYARDFSFDGELFLNIRPIIKEKTTTEYFEEQLPSVVRIENYFGSLD